MTLAIPLGPVEAFLLIATRVLAIFATSPVMSLKQVPLPARIGLGLFTSLLLVPVLSKDGIPSSVELTWTALAGEALVGALAGFASTVAYSAIHIAAGSFVVAVELVFPVLVALLLTDIALAVLAKVAPQFGIFSIGMQLKIGVALGALVVTLPLLMPRLHQLFTGVSAVSVAIVK